MALFVFSEAQKVSIRNYMGRSELNKELDPRLESIMNALSVDAGNQVVIFLTNLGLVDTQILTVFQNNLDLTHAETVDFAGEKQLDALRRTGREYVNKLATLLNVRPYVDIYSTDVESDGGILPMG